MATRRSKPVNRGQAQMVLQLLRSTKHDLEAYLDLENTSVCGLAPEVREPSVAYLSSWVDGPLDLAIRRLEAAMFPEEETNG